MSSLFPAEQRAPQPAFNHDDIPAEIRADFAQLLDWFTPNTYVCWIILALNVLIFGMMVVSGFNPDHATPQTLLKWGVDYGPATITGGQWWRVVTSCFIHLGIMHVAFNMFVLYQIGPFMERFLGAIGFLIVYMVAGVAGGICSLWWNPYVYSAGASGAIFGLYGALIGFVALRRDSIPGPVLSKLLKSALLFIAYNAVFGLIHAGTDVAAHVGGLLGGFACGLMVSTPISEGFRKRRTVRAAVAGLVCAVVLLAEGVRLPKPIDFQGVMAKFGVVEGKVLDAYTLLVKQATASTDAEMANKIQTQVIAPWNEERQSLAAITGLPGPQQHLIAVLSKYMDARRRGWNTLVQGLKLHDKNLVQQSFQQQAEAQATVKTDMAALKK